MKRSTLQKIALILSIIAMGAGLLGMVFCFFFLWSSNLVDVTGAGFPFVAGSVLFGGGLIAFTINCQGKDEPGTEL